jgi:annexin A7/11
MGAYGGQPAYPSPGYVTGQIPQGDASNEADALNKAMKGFGTDKAVLIRVLSKVDPIRMQLIRYSYRQRFGKRLEDAIASETGGHFRDGLLALVRGPLEQDVYNLFHAIDGIGTKEVVLNDVLLGRSNADLTAIKTEYHRTYKRLLESDVKGDLSGKTERMFDMVLAARRAEESAPVIPQQVDADVTELYRATEGQFGTDEVSVCAIITMKSDAQLRAISQAFEAKYRIPLDKVIDRVSNPFPLFFSCVLTP